MSRRLFFFLFVLIHLTCSAQSVEKRYSSYLSEVGTINFFRPKSLSRSTNVDGFKFDMTYVSHTDSVTVNCTLHVAQAALVKSLQMQNGEQCVTGCNTKVLFRDVVKDGFVIRTSTRFTFDDIKTFFSGQTPLVFVFQFSDGSQCSATYSSSQWKKERSNITRIFQTVNY